MLWTLVAFTSFFNVQAAPPAFFLERHHNELAQWLAQSGGVHSIDDLRSSEVTLSISRLTGDRFYVMRTPHRVSFSGNRSYNRPQYLFFADPELVNKNGLPFLSHEPGAKFPAPWGEIDPGFAEYQGTWIFLDGGRLLSSTSDFKREDNQPRAAEFVESDLTPDQRRTYFTYVREVGTYKSSSTRPNIPVNTQLAAIEDLAESKTAPAIPLPYSVAKSDLRNQPTALLSDRTRDGALRIIYARGFRQLVVGDSKNLILESLAPGEFKTTIPVVPGPILVAFSPKYLVLGDSDDSIRIYYLHTGEKIKTIQPNGRELQRIFFDGASLAVEYQTERLIFGAGNLTYLFSQSIFRPPCLGPMTQL